MGTLLRHFRSDSRRSAANHTHLRFVCDNDGAGEGELQPLCGHDCTVC